MELYSQRRKSHHIILIKGNAKEQISGLSQIQSPCHGWIAGLDLQRYIRNRSADSLLEQCSIWLTFAQHAATPPPLYLTSGGETIPYCYTCGRVISECYRSHSKLQRCIFVPFFLFPICVLTWPT